MLGRSGRDECDLVRRCPGWCYENRREVGKTESDVKILRDENVFFQLWFRAGGMVRFPFGDGLVSTVLFVRWTVTHGGPWCNYVPNNVIADSIHVTTLLSLSPCSRGCNAGNVSFGKEDPVGYERRS